MLASGFTGTADKFDILQACRRLLLEDVVTILRHAGIYDRPALEATQETCGKLFDELAAASRKGSFEEEADGLTASRISLMPESALELDIQLSDLSRRLLESQGEGLRKVYLRFVSLLNRPEMATEDNPAGIVPLIEGLKTLFMTLGRTTDEAIALLDPIEESFNQRLPDTYTRMSEVLESYGIAPALAKIQSSPSGPTGAAQAMANVAPSNFGATGIFNAPAQTSLGSLQAMMLARQAATTLPTTGTGMPGPVATGAVIAPAVLNQLIERIVALEAKGLSALTDSAGDGQNPPVRLPSATQLGLQGVEAATIDSLAMIFASIFDHPELPDAIKSSISSLQITLIKVAMLDPEFFGNPRHPARRLIDAMANCANTLPRDVDPHHPMMTALSAIAQQVRTSPVDDAATFDTAISNIESLLAERAQSARDASPSYLALVGQLQSRAEAEAEVAAAVSQLLGPDVPPELAEMIRAEWAQVLQAIAHNEGVTTPAWDENLEIIRKLIWSVSPMQTADERKQLASQVPTIIRGLNAGFERIQLAQTERDRVLDLCFAMQTAALRGVATSAQTAAADATPVDFDLGALAGPESTLTLPVFEHINFPDGLQLKVWRSERKESEAASVPLEMLSRLGDWLELKLPDGQTVRGLWTHTDQASGQILLQNPDWDYALLMAPEVLKYQLRSKQAKVLRPRSLFEEAANQALQKAQG